MRLYGLYLASRNDVWLRTTMKDFYRSIFGSPVPRDMKKVITQVTKALNGELVEREAISYNCKIQVCSKGPVIPIKSGIELVKATSKPYFTWWYEYNPEYFI